MNKNAEELNSIIKKENKIVFSMLSKKGKEIFFPKRGILSQASEAKGKEINAAIGMAINEDNSLMSLDIVSDKLNFDKKNAFPYAPSYGKLELRKNGKR